MLRRQPHLPEDLYPQLVTLPGQSGLFDAQTGKLTVTEFR
jgi:hypothetical protein